MNLQITRLSKLKAISMAQSAPEIKPTITQQCTHSTFTGIGDLIKLLPTGTFFLYTFLNPILTNNGKCNTGNRYGTSIFLALCGLASCFSWFTDSYIDSKGAVQYGIVTRNGLFPLSDSVTSSVDLSVYKRRLGDYVHALISIIVFAFISLLDANTLRCFYPKFESSQKKAIMLLPVVGAIASGAFVKFPNKRHGIGYPPQKASPVTIV
ncbi:hypothetical protein ACHQM5_026892 [Ranunculus cassubicifolius]